MIHIEGETEKGVGGRKTIPIEYTNVSYKDSTYIVGTIIHNSSPLKFIIDEDDFEKVKSRHWHAASDYIGSSISIEGKSKILYLHNVVMNKLTFEGKGAKETVDHINRIGHDNRKENLRIITQSQQNLNQGGKPRTCILPEGCGITSEDIPKHVSYIKASGLHGDRFGIDLRTEGIRWKTTSSKLWSLSEKLKLAKDKLEELYLTYPHLKPTVPDDSDYYEIIKLSESAKLKGGKPRTRVLLKANAKWRCPSALKRAYQVLGIGGKQINITFDEFTGVANSECTYCGRNSETSSMSVKRVDNTIGYVLSNVVACCEDCNIMKSDYCLQFFIEHVRKIAEYHKMEEFETRDWEKRT